MRTFVILSIILTIALSIFINWPAPPLSRKLIQWQEDGKWFKYNSQHDIFYRDDKGEVQNDDVLLLIHGFPTSTFDWSKIWKQIGQRYGRIVAHDMLGLGFSDKPYGHNYTMFEQADIIESLLKNLQLNRVHILAHDYGVTVAQELLHRYLERTKVKKDESFLKIITICLLNGGIFPETHIPRWSQEFLLKSQLKSIFAYISNQWIFSRELSSTFGELTKPTTEDLDDWWALMRYKDGHYVLPNLMQYIAQRRQNRERWVTALQTDAIPIHFVYGPLDPINPHPLFPKRYRTLLPLATIDTLPNVGHYVQWEAPQQMINSYFKFLDAYMSKKINKV